MLPALNNLNTIGNRTSTSQPTSATSTTNNTLFKNGIGPVINPQGLKTAAAMRSYLDSQNNGVLGESVNKEAQAAAAQRAADTAKFATQKSNIYGTANDAADNVGGQLRGSILDYVTSLKQGQRGIDESAVQNELAKKQGVQGVLGMVGRGIRSGGVLLSNKNAADSSAAGAIANAYGQIGRGELSNVGSQYEQGNRQINLDQQTLEEQRASGARKIGESKEQSVNNIVLDARDKFAQLDAAMADASLPERIAIEQEKEAVRGQVLARLQQYDQLLQSESAGVRATTADERMAEASRLAGAGQAASDAFQFNTEAPIEQQNTGPYASDLPLFSLPRAKRVA